ncbi:MAG TPA: hypothetical protein VFA04_10170 [Bryobacteraceae bacterium]|nr:hypothetical protein [Bryobacteraceae bacterium]
MKRRIVSAAVFAVVLSAVFAGMYGLVARFAIEQQKQVLDARWAAVKGYLRIQKYGPDWFYDPYDPEEARIANNLQHVYFLADSDGRALEISDRYRDIGVPKPGQVRAELQGTLPVYHRKDSMLLRAGIMRASDGRPYYLSIGRDISAEQRLLSRLRILLIVAVPLLAISSFALTGWVSQPRTA